MSEALPSQRIADKLREAIVNGTFGPGAKLPSERELARSYGTARNTARQAIAILQAEGLVEPEHGRGVYVRRRPPLHRLSHDRYSRRHREAGKAPFHAEVEAQGRKARVEVMSITPVPAPGWVASRLGLAEGERVLLRRNRYLADDQPVQLADTYIPWAIAEGSRFFEEIPEAGGIFAHFEHLGHRLTRFYEDVRARMPSPDEAKSLHLGRGVPVIEVFHSSFDQDGTAFEVTYFVLPADRNVLTFELPVS
jgi:GntR family transcriptional regulator